MHCNFPSVCGRNYEIPEVWLVDTVHGPPRIVLFIAAEEEDVPGNVLVIAGICRKQHQFRHDDDVITVYVVNSLFDQTEFFTVRCVCVDRVDAGYAADLNATGEVLLDIRQNFVPCFPGKYAGTDGSAYVCRDDVRLLGSLGHGHTYRRMEQRIEAGILTGQFTHFIPVPVGVTDVHTSLTK